MEIPEEEPRESFHNKDEADDDTTPDQNCSATFKHTDAVISSSKSPAHPHTSQPTETNYDLVLNAESDLEDAESDGESSTYSFIPGDHSQGPEVPDDVEEYLESVDISPIIGSANAVGGMVDQKKTCRRSLFEYKGDNEKAVGREVKYKVDVQEDVNEDFHLALDTSAEDWSPPIKSLVADYSSPGDPQLAGQHEEAGEMFKPFSQDAEGDQLLSAYMSGIEPILQDHFEPTCGKDVPPKHNNQVSDDLSRDVAIQTSQTTDRESIQIQSPLVKQTEEQEQQRQVMIRKTPAGNILQSSRYTSSTPSDQGSKKAAGKGGTPSEGKNENLERETEKDGVRQEALLAEPRHPDAPSKPTTSAQAGVQQTSITGLQHGQRKRRAHPGPSYSSPQKLLPSKKRQAKEEAIQKLTTKGRKEQKSSSSFPTTVERAKQNDHSYSKTSKPKKIEAEGWSGVQKKQQTVKDSQRAQSLLMNKIQQLSGSRLVLPTSTASSHAKSVEGRPKKKYLVAIEKGPNTLPSGKNMDKKILEKGHVDATHTRDVHQAKQRAKKTARMCAPCPVLRGASEALVVEETDTLSATQDTDTMDTVIPPTQIDDTMKKKYVVSPRGAQGKEKTSVSKARQEGDVETQDKQTTENDTAVQGQIEEIQVVQNQGPNDGEHPKGAAGKRPSQESAERGEAGNKKKARAGTSEKVELELFHMENTRGMYGWEDSLRQRPSPVKRFQPEAPPTADDKGKKRKKDEQSGAVKKKVKPQMQPLVFTTIRNNPTTSSKGNLAGPKDPPAASASTSSAAVSAPVSPGDIRTNSFPENGSPTDSGQEEQLPQEYKEGKYGMGELVFGKLKGYTWWPGRVVSCVETGRDPAPEGSCWVRWFGDGKFSIVQVEDKLEPFGKFSQLYHERTYNRLQTYKRAILESLQVAADRAKKKFLSSPDTHKNQDRDRTMVQWALQEFPPGGPDSLKPSAEEAKPPDHLVHQWLQARHLKQLEQVAAASSEGVSSEGRRKSVDSRLERAKLFEDVRKRQLSVDQLCLACGSLDVETQHPLFRGGLCEGCRIEFLESSYQFDEDGYQSYCSLCAAGTEVLMCGQDSCCRSFCKDCLDLIVGPGTADQAVLEDPWMCYMCREEPRHGLLHRQQDWSARLQQFFAMDDVQDFGEPKLYPPVPAQQRRPIRVLSLFDGIGTALLVLKDLGVTVDICYASEIDPDAIKVSQLRHAGGIRHLGDIRSIRNTDIPKLGPFDLVLGGSPCNDLSIANPNRAGLYAGTGVMFFHFYRLLQHAAPAPGDERPFFWLFENVVAMKHQYKQDISLFLGCNPVVVDAKDVSPAHRARYFWGNLPGMNRPLVPQASDKLALEQCLEKGCGRVAQVKKVRTVTTTLHSVRNQGKQQAAPVLMEGQPDTLWCTELERVFGFPSHYTDVCNMSRCSRQRLLGRAWSIPVIRHLLAPLKDYFQCQDKE
ncbi:PREDICTED: DNA (cytosine-5)-methyltransferase 3A-like [Branchiostoma belcheri]|uniref:DNA (cytosine-5-)-methyltransferase n=1 Tax=Branchiostoma belcheri TaxID=7741 RepID=A0A6P4ZBN7_BRABE|nr:PREDICTED: DNA (cytosine-5)-methyltransferase 3A-like [Branchiostoma belcheri]